MSENARTILLVLQTVQVIFLWLHDWLPLGSLNDVRAVCRQDCFNHLIVVTLIQSVPFTVILIFSALYVVRRYPDWLITTLWVAYTAFLIGQLRAWWVPYLFRADSARAARYRAMFGQTHSFLPMRNGLVPNTAHIFLHVCRAATLVALYLG